MTENPEEDSKVYMPVAAISKDDRCAVLEDGRICKFDKMYDAEGDETDDIGMAVAAIAPHPDGPWIVLRLHEFEGMTIH